TVLTWNWGGATGSGTGGGTTGAAAGGGETGGGPPGDDAAPRGRRCGAGGGGSSLAGTVPVDGETGTVDWSRALSTRASSGEAIDAPLSSSDGRRRGRPQTFCAREEVATPPATGGTATNADRHSPSGQALGRRHGGRVPRDAPGTAGSDVNAAGPHRRMAWRKTAKESARTDKLQQRTPSGPPGGRVGEGASTRELQVPAHVDVLEQADGQEGGD